MVVSLFANRRATLIRPEINMKPWGNLLKDLKEGNNRTKWMEREPYAYWKGNPLVAETRRDLLTCNVSDVQDWNARLFVQVVIYSAILLMIRLRTSTSAA